MYTTSGVVTSTVESDVTAPDVGVVLLLVYWLAQLHSDINAYESLFLPAFGTIASLSINNKLPRTDSFC